MHQGNESDDERNILFLAPITSLDSVYGDGLHVTKLAESFVSRGGYRVFLIARGTHDFTSCTDNIVTHRVPQKALLLGCGLAMFKALLLGRRIRFDFVYERGWYMNVGHIVSRLHGIPLVFEADGFAFETFNQSSIANRVLRYLMKRLESRAYKRAKLVVAPSQSVKNVLLNELGILDNSIALIPTGASPAQYSSVAAPPRCESNSADGRLNLFFAGKLMNWQGLDVIIDAFEQYDDIRMHFALKIAGDGPMKEELQARVRECDLQTAIGFLGRVPRDVVHTYIAQSDACLAPLAEWKSGLPLKIFEYMALGKPIIASRILDHMMVEEEGLGLLFEPGSSQDFARCLHQFKAECENISFKAARGRGLITSKYNWDSTVDSILRSIRAVTQK